MAFVSELIGGVNKNQKCVFATVESLLQTSVTVDSLLQTSVTVGFLCNEVTQTNIQSYSKRKITSCSTLALA